MKTDMPTFAGGEIGDDLLARDDTAKYRTSLRRARNVLLAPAGGAYRRPGLLLGGEVYNSGNPHRVIPFQFSVEQGYALELGETTLRVLFQGGYVLRKELLIQGITQESQAVVTVTGHGYLLGWDIVFQGVEGMTEINGKQGRVLEIIDADHFRISLDTSTFGVFTGSGGGVAGDQFGGTGGDPPPDPPPPPTTPPPPPPPFEDFEPPPDIYYPSGFEHIYHP